MNAAENKRIPERRAATPAGQRPHTDATFVVESASPASVSSATGDAVPTEQTFRTVRMLHPWSPMTEEPTIITTYTIYNSQTYHDQPSS